MPDSPSLDRRHLLRLAAASAAAGCLPRAAWSQARLPDNPFTLGVASGSPDATSVVLWTRLVHESLARAPATVRWEVAEDEAFRRVARSGTAQALPELAHSVHVEPAGLQPGRPYFYRFLLGDWTSTTGRTRTAPAPGSDVASLRIGYASCQRWEHGYFAAWRHMRQDDPDLVLFVGDYIYEYPTATNAVRSPGGNWVTTLDDYRARYALYRTDADLQAMHAACPWYLTWDDHEVQNDYAGLQAGQAGPEVADFPARRAAAYQAYYEHMPLRASALTRSMAGLASGAETRIHSLQPWGRLASLVLLDARQYRDPQACTRGGRFGSSTIDPAGCAAWNDPRRSMLGQPQEQWLDAQLAQSNAQWSLLAQSTLFGQRDFQPGAGQLLWNDGWDGYAPARARLVQSLRKHRSANPVFFGGDVHENWVGHVKEDYARPDGANVGVEFCGTSISSRTSGAERVAGVLAENPHFTFGDAVHRGYGIAQFTPSRLQVTLRGLDDVTRKDATVKTLAQFAVESGRPQVEKA